MAKKNDTNSRARPSTSLATIPRVKYGRVPTVDECEMAYRMSAAHARHQDIAIALGITKKTMSRWVERGRKGREGYAEFVLALDRGDGHSYMRLMARAEQQNPVFVLKVRHGVRDPDRPALTEEAAAHKAGLSDETVAQLKRQFLGITDGD